jgi:light-regulated signal transduction histidine kinase (bacteriophytochrome)
MIDLSSCEREPVHIPGAIQPHGALLVLDPIDLRVVGVSDNVERIMGMKPRDLLGRGVAVLSCAEGREELVECLRRETLEDHNPIALTLERGGRVSAIAHRHDGRLILDCEGDHGGAEISGSYITNRVRGSLARLRASSSLNELCERTAHEVQRLSGFDRVLIYAFQPDWTGEVVAEEAVEGLPRYLGLRFPASDIPSQARALYTQCRLRAIPTSTYTPSMLLGEGDGRPVDLTHAALRTISPVHLEYMRNMGVTASLGISLMHEDQLWGLVTCNHESGERFMSYEARAACALVGEVVSSLIGQKERVDLAEQRAGHLAAQAKLVQLVLQDRDVVRGLTGHTPSMLQVMGSIGAATWYKNELHCVGDTPPPAALRELLEWLEGRGVESLVTESLPAEYAPAHAWTSVGCGLVAIKISFANSIVVSQDNWLLWFRPEVVQAVSWGGDPTLDVSRPEGQRLHPRTSFERWRQEVHLRSVPFRAAEVAAAKSLAASLTDAILEVEATARIEEQTRLLRQLNAELEDRVTQRTAELTATLKEREVLLQEVHHRVKNNLQVVSSLIKMQMRRLSDQPSRDALDECRSRVQAIALIHEKLYQSSDYARVPFAEYAQRLAADVLGAAGASPGRVTLELAFEDIPMAVDKAIPCGLILNELITNALKHGFREGRGGTIGVALARLDGGRVRLTVWDDGAGMSEGSDASASKSLGMQLVVTLAKQLDGVLEVISGAGTRIELTFPGGE